MSRPAAGSNTARGSSGGGGAGAGQSSDTGSDTRAAALHGATRAFRPRSPSPDARGGYHEGALAAASRAASTQPPASAGASTNANAGAIGAASQASATRLTSPTRSDATHGEDPSLTAGRSAIARAVAAAQKTPQAVDEDARIREQSPSHIAATLAAARAPATSTSLPPSPRVGDFIRPPISPERSEEDDDEVDRRGIRATKHLIRAFEANHDGAPTSAGLTPSPSSRTRSPPRAIISPVPLRPSIPLLASRKAAEAYKPAVEPRSSPPAPPKKPLALVRRSTRPSEPESANAKERDRLFEPRGRSEGESLAHQKGSKITRPRSSLDAVADSDASSEASYASAEEALLPNKNFQPNTLARPPSLPIPKPMTSPSVAPKHALSRPRPPPPPRIDPPRRPSSTVAYAVPHAPALQPQLTADSLADAIVASSLAGSRVASPTRSALATPPPPRPWSSHGRRGSRGFLQANMGASNNNNGALLIARTPSPLKAMRHTLRAEPPAGKGGEGDGSGGVTSGDESHRKSHRHHRLMRKHPHKHAEGDRRRWRDVIAESERRRYEGVWAANRGILLLAAPDTSSSSDDVHAYVVRDIWSRSGLNTATLAQVWDLVAAGGALGNQHRTLQRDEFVVGLWLIDQCLKGRRLPVEVGESVWGSVRGLMSGLRGR